MKEPRLQLQNLRVENFKAIRKSKLVRFGSLTVFIGHNGSGKSSLIEALETYQSIVLGGLDSAMQRWLGIEHVRNKSASISRADATLPPIRFEFTIGASARRATHVQMEVNVDAAANRMYIAQESSEHSNGWFVGTQARRDATDKDAGISMMSRVSGKHRLIAQQISEWQFLTIQPERMGMPIAQQRTGGRVRLAKDGGNIADYLLDIQRLDVENKTDIIGGIVRTMEYVLPYARDLQPALTTELERKAYLQLTEADYKIPGWMLSAGTLRVLALLALLRHPKPPPLIVVEEIENGLDPRSIHLIVEEIRTAILSGVTQVICTTHSPYLLDLLKLDQLVLVARDESGHPKFERPADSVRLQEWSKEFSPGRLYTMGAIHEQSGS